MTSDECAAALEAGRAIDALLGDENVGIVGYGEIGIGNTSAAAMIAHTLTGIDLATLVGPGAGAPALGLDHKHRVLSETVERAQIEFARTRCAIIRSARTIRRLRNRHDGRRDGGRRGGGAHHRRRRLHLDGGRDRGRRAQARDARQLRLRALLG